ncbi:ArsR family transcriptional regulator [Methanoplanus sp. FWC-SCC4]|uniref:ArsR family transcriptional regulator n=1 Tax=Methanochimaera problematica TaxID=2609417 RepID=A0AA97FEA8_9EURY|nr:winged helix-turn-helix domain-containing protein [Methanoplanus sp. FWC-SCC4]WOF16654.1 ArsR family transcriptional regulator [Methanoplanus sp. FWC-SCC4]
MRLSPKTLKELSDTLSFLGNEQRINIIRSISSEEKFAREISEELGISRPLVNIYLKQLEKAGFVEGINRTSDEPPYLRRYYRALPFELSVNLDEIKKFTEV